MFFLGCSSSYQIEVIEGEAYLQFSKGDDVKMGDAFTLYTPSLVRPKRGRPAPPQYKKKTIGRVRVTKFADEKHAVVTLLEGQIEHAVKAMRTEDGD